MDEDGEWSGGSLRGFRVVEVLEELRPSPHLDQAENQNDSFLPWLLLHFHLCGIVSPPPPRAR